MLPASGQSRRNGHDAAGILLPVIGLRPLEDHALVGGAADFERLAVEVFAAKREGLAQPHPRVGEDADHCLAWPRSLGEAVHLLEAEDADRPGLLLRSWIVRSDPNTLERVEVRHFIGNRVLGHRRKRTHDADDAGSRPSLDSEHVVDQGEDVTAAQLAH